MTIGGEIPTLAAEVGATPPSDHLYWECRKQYELQAEKLAWQFWKATLKLARTAKFFSKNEQV